jgi:hypothetical protein
MKIYKIDFPVKGTYYYQAAELIKTHQLNEQSQLILQTEPENVHDRFAIQVKFSANNEQALIGYIPRLLSHPLSRLMQNRSVSIAIKHLAKSGQYIEIDLSLSTQMRPYEFYWFKLLTILSQFQKKLVRMFFKFLH